MKYSQWEIVYIKFPFTDLSDYKVRPALVISNALYNEKDNVFLVGIFWNQGIKEYSLELEAKDLISGAMLKKSYFRFQNMFSLDKKLIVRKIGVLQNSKLKEIVARVDGFIH